jgi:hypothetical protein
VGSKAEFIHGVNDHTHTDQIQSPTGLVQHLQQHHESNTQGDMAMFELQDIHREAHGM